MEVAVPDKYQFICGYLKANEKKLFSADTRRRIEASATIEDLFRALVETHFQPLAESGAEDEHLLDQAERIVGLIASSCYRFEGSTPIFYALIPNFIESLKLIWLEAEDRLTSSGFTLNQLKNLSGIPRAIIDKVRSALESNTSANTLRQLEYYSFIEKRRMMDDLARSIGSGLERLNQELLAVEDAFLFYWFLFRNPDYLSATEMSYLKPHLSDEFASLAEKKIAEETLRNFTTEIRVRDPLLADTCLLFMKTELKDALVLKHELEAMITRKYPVMEVGPFYPVYYFLRLNSDLKFLKSNILRILSAQERRKSAA